MTTRFFYTHIPRLAFCVLFCSSSLTATAIAVLITDKAVTLGVDGKATIQWYGQPIGSQTRCKLAQSVGLCFFAASGLYEDEDTGFNIYQIADSACRASLGFSDRLKSFDARMGVALPATIEDMRRRTPYTYSQVLVGRTIFTVFAGVENGRAVAIIKEYYVSQDELIPRDLIRHDTSEFGATFGVFQSGINNEVISAWTKTGVYNVSKLLQMEIEANPSEVGPPISVLAIENDGTVRWIEQGACPDINPEPLKPSPAKTQGSVPPGRY